jgi:hypothetical protein
MQWKQTGDIYKADLGKGYTIVKHEEPGHRWFLLKYGGAHVGASYTSLVLAKKAAELHEYSQKGSGM